MKGIVFTEFLEFVEDKFGLEMVDKIIERSNLESNGVYTAVGTYNFSELIQLLNNLSANTNISLDNLLLFYGEHFFNVLEKSYRGFSVNYNIPVETLSSLEKHVHLEI